ncbi:MAG: sulfotransferase [bacterium]|nr:sulfotransferase [bacterium]
MSEKIKPNFFIVGMPRCGTTSMFTYLKQHPQVFLPIHKEPHYFSRDVNFYTNYVEKENVYFSLFEGAGDKKAVGEASVWYLTSERAAALIKKTIPGAKIIIMLRNPVDQMHSLHHLWLNSGNEDEADLLKAIEMQEKRKNGLCLPENCYFPQGLLYTEIATYFEKIKRFTDEFGMKNVRFILFDEFVADLSREYKKILTFLEVDDGFSPEFDTVEAEKSIRGIVINQLRTAHPEIKKIMRYGVRKRAQSKKKCSPLPPEVRASLQKLFTGDLEKTGTLIGKALSHWC